MHLPRRFVNRSFHRQKKRPAAAAKLHDRVYPANLNSMRLALAFELCLSKNRQPQRDKFSMLQPCQLCKSKKLMAISLCFASMLFQRSSSRGENRDCKVQCPKIQPTLSSSWFGQQTLSGDSFECLLAVLALSPSSSSTACNVRRCRCDESFCPAVACPYQRESSYSRTNERRR